MSDKYTATGQVSIIDMATIARYMQSQGTMIATRSEVLNIAIGHLADIIREAGKVTPIETVQEAVDILTEMRLVNTQNKTTNHELFRALRREALEEAASEVPEAAQQLAHLDRFRDYGAQGAQVRKMKEAARSAPRGAQTADSNPFLHNAQRQQNKETREITARAELNDALMKQGELLLDDVLRSIGKEMGASEMNDKSVGGRLFAKWANEGAFRIIVKRDGLKEVSYVSLPAPAPQGGDVPDVDDDLSFLDKIDEESDGS